jgi:hypothetical protein
VFTLEPAEHRAPLTCGKMQPMGVPDKPPRARGAPLERGAAADVWRNTLSQIPSTFGRLVYLSSLRDPNSSLYQHHGLAHLFSEMEADKALRFSHEEVFAQWLCLTLEQQKRDLDLYLSGLEGDRRTVLRAWLQLASYRNSLPATAREVERDLFLTDLETLLELLKNEYGVSVPDPDA